MNTDNAPNIEPAKPVDLGKMVEYSKGSIVSRTIEETDNGTLTLFAFDAGQSLSEHTAPYNAYVVVLDGEAELTIGDEVLRPGAGELTLMPADVPHAVRAPEPFKMMLVMLRH
jgi:quercetin dioxygenase-like cupin family protein